MGIRAKTIGSIAVLVLVLWVALLITVSSYGARTAASFERTEVEQTLQRAAAAISSQRAQLKSVVGDWALWTDTYRFVRGDNPAYPEDNLADDSIANIDLDFMVFLDGNGAIFYGKAIDPYSRVATELPDGLAAYLSSRPALSRMTDPKDTTTGVLALPEGPVVIAAEPISTGDGSAPPAGTLVIGRALVGDRIDAMRDLMATPLRLYDVGSRQLPSAAQGALVKLNSGRINAVVPSGANVLGYTVYNGLDRKPAVLVEVQQPRTVVQLTNSGVARLSVGLGIMGLALVLALVAVVDVSVLSRLKSLRNGVADVGRSGDASARLHVRGNDEISQVTESINGMLAELERSQSDLAYLATHDSLTRLYNRRRFETELARELEESRGGGSSGAMLWFDLDNFKEINDSLGHAAGDKLLQSVANLLSGETRGYSLVARLGGDEFGLLIPRADATEAVNTAMRILDVMAIRSFSVASHEVRVSASVGVVLYPTHGESVDDLLARADLAMYHAKSHGGNRLSVYTSDDHWRTEMSERIGLAEHIVSALRDDRLRLFAQPTVRVEDGSPGPTELLLRMDDGEGGFVLPDEILSTATRIGLSRDVDAWVVRKAIALLAAEQAGGSLVPLSVNLTGAALSDPDIIRAMADAAAQSGADLAGLVVEVGEASAVADIQRDTTEAVQKAQEYNCDLITEQYWKPILAEIEGGLQ